MSPLQSRTLKIAAVWSAILLTGVAAGAWNAHRHADDAPQAVLRAVSRAAVAFDAAEVRQLVAGNSADPRREVVQERLRKFKAVDPRVRAMYLLRIAPGGDQPITLATSDPGPAQYGRTPSAALGRVLQTGQPAVEGPMRADTETWMTGWTLIDDTADAPAKHVLGLDVDAEGWRYDAIRAWLEGAFYCWLLFGLPFAAWLVMQRQHEQGEVIRNLSEAMEQSHSAIMIVDLDGRVEYANRGLCRQIGYTRRELIGREWRELQAHADGEGVVDMLTTARAGRAWEGEWMSRHKDGSVHPVRGIITPVKHRDGTLACFVTVYDDITEVKRREAELREARDAALAGDRAKGQFLATMSHEVRTPLNGIVGFTSLLLETPLNAEQREYVQTIRVSTEALIQLTGDILDFARIESGKLKLDPLACDPRECTEDALDLLAAKAAEKKLELLHRVAADVPAAIIADGGRLRQILVNLIGNAVKFTEHGEVEVSVARVSESGGIPASEAASQGEPALEDDNCMLRFSVRDTGIGIAPEHHEKLFRPFTQVDETTTRRYGGTGLGLAISRNLVDLMGGKIEVASQPGQGSTFSFMIRAAIAAPHQPAHDLGGLRFALAVSSQSLRQELAALARSWKADVVAVATGAELAGERWDVALLEMTEETAHQLVGTGPIDGFPADKCIGLVPISLPNDLRASLRTHFRLLVNKPVHHDTLFSLLSSARSHVPTAVTPTQFGLRTLVVEDNLVDRRLTEEVVRHVGCSVTVVENGAAALKVLAAHADEFDVVLLDLHLPDMTGISALREIRAGRAGPRAQSLWVIGLTADGHEEQRVRSMHPGLNDYLNKPLGLAELEAALRHFRNERMARKH